MTILVYFTSLTVSDEELNCSKKFCLYDRRHKKLSLCQGSSLSNMNLKQMALTFMELSLLFTGRTKTTFIYEVNEPALANTL